MKVLFISHYAARTGAPLALLQLVKAISSNCKDINIDILFLESGDLIPEFKELCTIRKGWPDYSIANRVIKKLQGRDYSKPYLYSLRNKHYDCIYANTIASFHVAIELKSILNVPLIGHVHEAECAMYLFKMTKDIFREFTRIIAVSELTANNLMDIYDVPKNHIIIQYPFSPWVEKYIKGEIQIAPKKAENNKTIVGLFCNGGWFKSAEIIPLAIKKYQDKYPENNCIFAIVGKLKQADKYFIEHDLKKLNILDKVSWIGETSNPLVCHNMFDIYLLLSRQESFSLAAQEAAIMKKPIIAFRGVTGVEEWLRDRAGVLITYLDLDELADTINELSNNKNICQEIGRNAHDIVLESYYKFANMNNCIETIRKVVTMGRCPNHKPVHAADTGR